MAGEYYQEIWAETPDGQQMCCLISGEVGWLLYMRNEGDAGFSSHNDAYEGDAEKVIEYVLSNGQQDEYPASWALPVSTLKRALAYFEKEQGPPPFIRWHNHSGDGVELEFRPLNLENE